jgi:alkylated DNA repair protein (DNA oxidative demethylase)
MLDLFDEFDTERQLAEGAIFLRGFALPAEAELLAAVRAVSAEAPFRHMVTPGGFTMSVAMTNCGAAGWVTDRSGYRYTSDDPESGKPWPALPAVFADLAGKAAAKAGYPDFMPDACLVNRYEPGAKMSLHQDRNERDFAQPIVSVSLGLPAARRIPLDHGDVVVWGGPSRLFFHGVTTLADGSHPLLGRQRINLTFRRAL